MLSLLVVDDEIIQRKGIVTSIDWSAIGAAVVGEGADGREGLALIKELHPDLVITDIRMPVMDGLEMIEAVRRGGKRNTAPHFIILSGYEDFKYAQSAIRLGVLDYVLKPVDADELLSLVSRAKAKIKGAGSYSFLLGNRPVSQDSIVSYKDFPKKIEAELRRGGENKAEELVEKMFSLFVLRGEDFFQAQSLVLETLSYLRAVFSYLFMENEGTSLGEISRIETLQELRRWTLEQIRAIRDAFESINSNHGWMIRRISAYVEKHYGEEITVPILAAWIGFSPNYFSKVFREQMGLSFSEWLNRFRIEKAKQLLQNSSERIADIAEMTGYGDYKYFTYVFRQQEGISPSNFRRLRKG
jgi:two-component system response regulator YesN